jgi:hypothetical protein
MFDPIRGWWEREGAFNLWGAVAAGVIVVGIALWFACAR